MYLYNLVYLYANSTLPVSLMFVLSFCGSLSRYQCDVVLYYHDMCILVVLYFAETERIHLTQFWAVNRGLSACNHHGIFQFSSVAQQQHICDDQRITVLVRMYYATSTRIVKTAT